MPFFHTSSLTHLSLPHIYVSPQVAIKVIPKSKVFGWSKVGEGGNKELDIIAGHCHG